MGKWRGKDVVDGEGHASNNLIGAEENFEAAGVDVAKHANYPQGADPIRQWHIASLNRSIKKANRACDCKQEPRVHF